MELSLSSEAADGPSLGSAEGSRSGVSFPASEPDPSSPLHPMKVLSIQKALEMAASVHMPVRMCFIAGMKFWSLFTNHACKAYQCSLPPCRIVCTCSPVGMQED